MARPTSSDTRLVRLHGRETEVAALDDHLDALGRGRGGVVLLEGAGGVGKSRLLDEALARAERRGLRTARGAGEREARDVALGPLLEALLAGDAPVLDRVTMRALAALDDPRFWQVEEIAERLAQAARHGPIVVAIDDLQWVDEATESALRALPRRLARLPVLWLLTVRSGAARPTVDVLAAGGGVPLAVEALDQDAALALAADVLGAPPDDALRERVAAAGGHARLLVELLRGVRDEGHVDLADGLPRRLRDAVAAELSSLSPAGRTVVELGSALGRRFTAQQIATLLDLRPAALVGGLREALEAGILAEAGGALAFRCDLMREAVDAGLPATVRAALRRQAVALLLADEAPTADVGALLLEVAEPGDMAAVAALRRAAADLAPTSPSMAARLSRRALDLTPRDDPGRSVAVADTIPFLLAAGRADEARALADTALDRALAPEAEATLRLALAQRCAHDAPELLRQCAMALALPDLPGGLLLRLRVLRGLGHALDGDVDALCATADGDLAAARAAGDPELEHAALVNAAAAEQARHRHSAALALLAEAGEPDARRHRAMPAAPLDLRLWTACAALVHAASGSIERALALAGTGVRSADGDAPDPDARLWLSVRAQVRLAAGRLDGARADAEAALAGAPASVAAWPARCVLGRVAAHAGDRSALAGAAAAARDMRASGAAGARRAGAWLGALVAGAEGDARRGVALLDDVAAAVAPAHADVLLALLRVARGAGDRAAEETMVREAERRARADAACPLAAVTAALARGALECDARTMRAAAASLSALPGDVARAGALEDVAEVLAASSVPDAVARLDDALALYDGAGCARDAARVRRRLRDAGVRRRRVAVPRAGGWAGLTAAELAVVEVVAGGATNRDAAEQLFLSPHTVSSHLRHAFEKLGISSRVELARLYAERAGATDG